MSALLNSSLKKEYPQKEVSRIGFLLLNNFTMIALASAVEPLRMANQLSGKELYDWYTITENGESVAASDGITVTPDTSINTVPKLDTLIVVGGVNITRSYTRRQVSWVQSLARKHVNLGGVCTGPYLLADAGVMDGYECSAHWECIAALQEAYPRVSCTNNLFVIDRDRMTSTGGSVPMDMMINMIKRDYGHQLAASISEMFICDRIRGETDYQRIPLRHVLGTAQPKLVEAITLMEANIEETIELDELATYVGLSRRQLERLFQKYLQCPPSKYYLKLRLFRARQLLRQTSMSIIDIATACGFVSSPHFSKCYRIHIGISPRAERLGHGETEFENVLLTPDVIEDNPVQADISVFEVPSLRSSRALYEAQYEPTYGSVLV
ncbi:GlxA family transcriptional regulator [Vibrio gazogenes]|uniref:Transcriptional regulator GlxA family, contains an amidase domain and an AraC-type DNA-binding HTH domain n=1 Tax=Vibrio gazogenes DSM 21264 = NBRC 103151 TaxID=1123492 RepID=A0A1M5EJQ2_VIBGA|nr:GlxA family transcriptional regulator [Vibrio gazogenes]USP12538.1 GlxA family transcriptional regulator [Vibrio gazogenes]SHF79437.1 Transcriptional regulator GlxA family, contains an amidase domain and an AraC-type DNA-binding HTH domain [Vibrio gazogenes DSM 21264] [Vibrio gazogenes DSM 21264 = NBRC 103151]SJN54011.1 HTH-type transcriptional regulator CdhR [Vibrio gazogenes]